jgi:hypothetical protein
LYRYAAAGDTGLGWKSRLRCFAALVRLSQSGSNRAYLAVGAPAHVDSP